MKEVVLNDAHIVQKSPTLIQPENNLESNIPNPTNLMLEPVQKNSRQPFNCSCTYYVSNYFWHFLSGFPFCRFRHCALLVLEMNVSNVLERVSRTHEHAYIHIWNRSPPTWGCAHFYAHVRAGEETREVNTGWLHARPRLMLFLILKTQPVGIILSSGCFCKTFKRTWAEGLTCCITQKQVVTGKRCFVH